MIKIAQIINETPDFAFSEPGCTPCECGDIAACIQEKNIFLESVPTVLISYLLGFGYNLILILLPTVVLLAILQLFKKIVSDIYQRYVSLVIGNILGLYLYLSSSMVDFDMYLTLFFAQIFLWILLFFKPLKDQKIKFSVFLFSFLVFEIIFYTILYFG